MKRAALVVLMIPACSNLPDELKLVEDKAYDGAAKLMSAYCEQVTDPDVLTFERVMQEKRELRREVRQRGENGPPPDPQNEDRDGNSGPIVVVWCDRSEVPDNIWPVLDRDWQPGEP